MLCPTCQSKTEVLDSRQFNDTTRRKRRCKECEDRFHTLEVLYEKKKSKPKPKIRLRPKNAKKRKSRFQSPPVPVYDNLTDDELENMIFSEDFKFDEDEI